MARINSERLFCISPLVQVPFLHAFLLTGQQSLIAAVREASIIKKLLNIMKTIMFPMLAESNLTYFSPCVLEKANSM